VPRGLWITLAAVAAVILAGYGHTLGYAFQFDDLHTIRDNPLLDRPWDWSALWHHRPSRFVLSLSLAWNVLVAGRAPADLRAVNLAIQGANALLVGWIGATLQRRLAPGTGRDGAAAARAAVAAGAVAALLFAAHPLATEAVTYLYQRATSLAALWMLASVALYLEARAGRGTGFWVASWIAALLAALTKEMSVALPLAIACIEWRLRRREYHAPHATAPRLAWFLPYLLVPALVAVVAQLPSGEEGAPPPGLRQTDRIGRLAYLCTQMTVIPRYLALVVWPRGQTLDWDVRLRAAPDATVLGGGALLAALTAAAWSLRRARPLVWLGWLWFAVVLLPESSVFPIADLMFEHRVYLPLAGLAWAAGSLAAPWLAADRRRWLAVVLAIAALTAVTHERNRVWSDPLTLWSDVTAKAPFKARGFNNLGLAHEERGETDAAIDAYRHAVALDPDHLETLLNLARLEAERGDLAAALRRLQHAEALVPGAPDIQNDLATTWWALGDTARAAACYLRALELCRQASEVSPRALEIAPVARRAAGNLARLRAGGRVPLSPAAPPAPVGAR
jgi:tetratricopeptide (TPR) repeat protein